MRYDAFNIIEIMKQASRVPLNGLRHYIKKKKRNALLLRLNKESNLGYKVLWWTRNPWNFSPFLLC